jgi:hypothetical protein
MCPKTLNDMIFGRLFSRACNFLHELQTYPYIPNTTSLLDYNSYYLVAV